ncbi:curli biogenesis system outer membrane secretion channel CsgG [Paucibacter oligotrophus]|uniref:Curli biogenesis system outer membrane secretion channel CsgG n=1 Tax=Roseateles oligotrophus TaxID=1769250 RepID=A0A840L5K4_9BURK|nr:CsgG/HfaB family protein [Roseateles oligotrophus]MBB4841825.1 curli biogenesis system outer membrane secretion channel CsgG [Roseateles oligotrophus]
MNKSFQIAATAALVLAAFSSHVLAQETSSTVEKCSKKLGVMAVVEPQIGWTHLSQYGLGSPSALLRMMIQQSGCFDVVERGVAMQNLQQERALGQSGELRDESNVGKGQMQAADFVMTPNVQVGSSDTGGIGGALFGRLGVLGAIAGGLKFKEASTSLMVADVRSSIQVAAAEGKATKTDFGIGGWAFGGGAAGALGGYTKTPEGKMVAASLLDNYNKIVLAIRDQPQLIKTSSAAGDANAAASTKAEAPQAAGQMLAAKIANVKAYEQPSRDSKVLATLQRSDELVATGEVKNGFVRVDAANFSGWVQRTLVGPADGNGASNGAAPPVMPVQAVLPPGIFGNFGGKFMGSDLGTFDVIVSNNGHVTGSGYSQQTGQFNVNGQVDASGNVNLSAHGTAGAALFTGRIDGQSGIVSGTWRYSGRMQGGGSFRGVRQ